MSYLETTVAEPKNQPEISGLLEPPSPSFPKTLFFLKIFQYLFLVAFVCSGVITIILPEEKPALIYGVFSLSLFIFTWLINKSVSQIISDADSKIELKRKAELYLLSINSSSTSNSLASSRAKALRYSQELIDDYKRIRNQARIFYYVLQLSTIVFSGVTPILVLVDKLEAGQNWLKWLPVICPAIASIVASVVTSFPFQKNWIAANRAVELLEAEQEKFILGVTQPYRCYDSSDDGEQQQKAKQAIENFIVQVNNIHLQLLQESSENPQKEEKKQSDSSPQEVKQ